MQVRQCTATESWTVEPCLILYNHSGVEKLDDIVLHRFADCFLPDMSKIQNNTTN